MCIVMGTLLSGVVVQVARCRWMFWFTTLAGVPSALLALLLIPSQDDDINDKAVKSRLGRVKRLDLVGVAVLTGENKPSPLFLIAEFMKRSRTHPIHIRNY